MLDPVIRPYRPEDRAAVADVCVRTADLGEDSRELYPDHELVPSIFALPYVELEPELAFVLDDGERAVGYVLGTADTPRFARRFRDEWLPTVVDRFPPPSGPPVTPSDRMRNLLYQPEGMLPTVPGYPAHLHIDLLPEHQGAGHGRALMTTFLRALGAAGVPAVHLAMATANTRARAFYDRMDFHEIPVRPAWDTTYLGRRTITT